MNYTESMSDCSFTEDADCNVQVVKIETTKDNENEYHTYLTVSFEHVPAPVGRDMLKLLVINRMIY